MKSPSFIQTLENKSWRFKHASTLEDVLCLATLIAHKTPISEVDEARDEYLRTFDADCLNCPYHEHCLACLINE